MTTIYFRAGLMLPLLATLPVAATAQAWDSTTVSDTTYALPALVVTTSRLPTAHARTGFAAVLIGPDQLRAITPRSTVDLFRDQSGIFIDESVGPGGPTILRVRGGEEVFTQVLVDGVQINQNGGFFDMLGLQLSNLDRVEVARGPQSAVYGSSAVSGLVHFVTPPGAVGPPRFTTKLEGGAASKHGGRWRGEGSVRGGSERFRYSAGLGAGYSRGVWALPNDTKNRDGALRLDLLPADNWSLGLKARKVFVKSMLPVRDLGTTRVPLDPNTRDEFDRTILSFTVQRAPSASASHSLMVGHFRENFVFEDELDGVVSPPGTFVFDANLRFVAELSRTTVRYSGSARVPDAPLDFAWGAQWEQEDLSNLITGDFQDDLQLDRASQALFAELGWQPLGQLSVLLGARAEKFEGLDWELTPRFGASLRFADGRATLRSSVGRAYKAPNLQQQFVDSPFILANPGIRPETSLSSEVGIDVSSATGKTSASVTVFRQTFDDLIRTVAVEGQSQQTNVNLGSARATGIEWSVLVTPTTHVSIGSDGAWIETKVLDNVGLPPDEYPVGAPLPFRPALVASAFVEVTDGTRVTARLRLSRIGGQDVLSDRFGGLRVAVDGYSLVGLNVSYTVRRGVAVYARADNLFDTFYLASFDRPGAAAAGTVGAEFVF